jgi:hypothetical protein
MTAMATAAGLAAAAVILVESMEMISEMMIERSVYGQETSTK